MSDFRIAVLGDSVAWGEGLLEEQKYFTLVGQAIEAAPGGARAVAPPVVLAHCGAVIGAGLTASAPPVHGEVPRLLPSILDQCAAFPDPAGVDLVLLTGGINDVGVLRILSPLTPPADLKAATWRHCYTDMTLLLEQVAARFINAEIMVSGYFPILSVKSDPLHVWDFLGCFGFRTLGLKSLLPVPWRSLGADPVTKEIVANCQLFWEESETALGEAVRAVSAAVGGSSPRIRFATPTFTEWNAALARDAWLWGIIRTDPTDLTSLLAPEDSVADVRRDACNQHEPNPLWNPLWTICCYASAGHPNVAGARQYARAITAALGL